MYERAWVADFVCRRARDCPYFDDECIKNIGDKMLCLLSTCRKYRRLLQALMAFPRCDPLCFLKSKLSFVDLQASIKILIMALFSQLGNYRNAGLFIMRAGLGAMMIFHGLPKITHPERWAGLGESMGNFHIHFLPAFFGFMCALIETVGGLFSILGLWFRLVCMFLIIVFIVAAVKHINAGEGLGKAAEAIELGFAYIGLFFLGPGRFSVDKG